MIKARKREWEIAQQRWAAKVQARELEAGSKVWKQVGRGRGGQERQLVLIREIIQTRKGELRKAYPDLLGIGAGIGTTKRRDSGACIIFLVEKKKARPSRNRQLPAHLFAFCEVRGNRRLCAVPTDIEEQRAYRSVRAHASQQIQVSSGSSGPITGLVTIPIRLRYSNGKSDRQLYALSCLHVLGMAQQFFPALGPNCEFRPTGATDRIGTLSGYIGRLVAASDGYSFDAALGVVDDDPNARALLEQALPVNWPRNRIFGPDEIPVEAEIIPNNKRGVIRARRRTTWVDDSVTLNYEAPTGLVEILHADLVEWDAATQRGDSGSPVVARNNPDLLLGIHIAGDEHGTALMIPAYELFNPVRFHLDENDTISIPTTL
jgi:hypothetical protein